jgi:hypothetical protein
MRRAAILAGLLLALPSAVAAEDAAAPADAAAAPAIRVGPRWAACAAEVQIFCAGIERGQGWVRTCLRPHFKVLSEPCKAVIGPDSEPAK